MKVARAALFASLATAFAATAAETQEVPALRGHVVYRLAVDGGGLGYHIDDTVLFMEVPLTAPEFWVAERRQHETPVAKPRTFRHQWIDGRRCPALARVLASIGEFRPVRIGPPDNRERSIVFDSARIALAGPMTSGEALGASVTVAQESGWLHDWWRKAGTELAPCWRNTPRSEDGGPSLPTLLFTDQDAKALKP